MREMPESGELMASDRHLVPPGTLDGEAMEDNEQVVSKH
jgi:hypothetical protein